MNALCVQFSRGMAPPESIAAAVGACSKHGLVYHQINEQPAVIAKQRAAEMAHEQGRDLLLIEDDILAPPDVWKAALAERETVTLATCLMKNGMVNVWFDGDRFVYSGSVFLHCPWDILHRIGTPWFDARDLKYSTNSKSWTDHGPNPDGQRSDVFFWMRCWQCGIQPRIVGDVVHIIHEYNATRCDLANPCQRKFLGMMHGSTVVG